MQTLKTAAVPIAPAVAVVVSCVACVACVAVVAFFGARHKNCLFIFAATANFIIIFVLDNDNSNRGRGRGVRGGAGRAWKCIGGSGGRGGQPRQPNGSLVVSCLFWVDFFTVFCWLFFFSVFFLQILHLYKTFLEQPSQAAGSKSKLLLLLLLPLLPHRHNSYWWQLERHVARGMRHEPWVSADCGNRKRGHTLCCPRGVHLLRRRMPLVGLAPKRRTPN